MAVNEFINIQPYENQKKDFGPNGYKVLFQW